MIAQAALAAVLLASPTTVPAVDQQPRVCQDRLAQWIHKAGFKGVNVKVAWAVAMRESTGNPRESSWPDLGLMQLNAVWQGTKYWPANVYDPIQNLTAARRMVRDMNWQPWGLRVKGGKVTYDFSAYGMWSSWHHQNWIVAPFERYWRQFPKGCAR